MADTVSTVNTNTSNLPAYLEPYITQLAQAGQANYGRGYEPNPNQRVADFDPAQVQAQNDVMAMERPGEYGTASGLAAAAGMGGLGAGNYDPASFSYERLAPGSFGAAEANQYMSPYMQSVVDVTKRNALLDAQKTQLMSNLGAARQGTYGGSRELLAGMERERNLGTNLSDIQAKGLQSAWEQAQQQYNADSNRQLTAGQSNQTAGLRSQELGEQSRQFGGTLGLQGMDTALKAASTLGTLGNDVQASDLKRIGAMSGVGAERQGLEQQRLDVKNADFYRQQDFPNTALNTYSGILRGIPAGTNQTTTSTSPAPSTLAQLGGVGLGALSLVNLLK